MSRLPPGWDINELGGVAEIRPSNVDKIVVPGESLVRLCNYLDVYTSRQIDTTTQMSGGSATPSEIRRFGLKKGDVLITKDSETPDDIAVPSYVATDLGDVVCGYHLALVRPKPEIIDGEYLSYLLRLPSTNRHFSLRAFGSTRYGLGLKSLGSAPVTCPPLKQQRRIAEVLSTVDGLIEKTEALIAKQEAVKIGMMADLLSAPRSTYRTLGSASVKIQDGTHFSPKSQKGSFRYITSKNIRPGYMSLENCEWVSAEEHDEIFARCDVRKGDVLLTKDGANTGNACLNELDEPFSLLSSVAFIRCDDRTLHNDFLLHYLLSPVGQQRLKDLMAGNAITRLTLEKIRAFDVPCPESSKQQGAASALNAVGEEIHSLDKQAKKARLIKMGLMADLLSGRVSTTRVAA